MILTDIITLASKGYKPSDIKELLELGNALEDKPEEPAEDKEPEAREEKLEDPKPENENPDPEKEKLQAEIISLQEKIKELQRDNTTREISGEVKTDEEKFEELVKDFF